MKANAENNAWQQGRRQDMTGMGRRPGALVILALVFGSASGALAATKHRSLAPNNSMYDARGLYIGSDPDENIRFVSHEF